MKGDAALGLPKPRLRRPAATTGRRAPEKPGPALGEREVSGEGEDFGECPAVVGDLGDPWRMALLNLLTEWKFKRKVVETDECYWVMEFHGISK